MALPTASDNPFPSILITEGTEPAAPAAGKQRLYIDSTTHKFKRTDSSGVDVTIEGNTSTVATDTIWDAAGDLVVGTGADAAAKLAKGAAGAYLSTFNGVVGWNGGTAFPGSPATNDRYWRTDLGLEFYYDGTRWLSTALYTLGLPQADALAPLAATATGHRLCLPILGTGIRVIDFWVSFYVNGGTALSDSHKWVLDFKTAVSGTVLATYNIGSGASSAWRSSGLQSVASNVVTTEFELEVLSTKTGTPGNLSATPMFSYRIIQT